MPTIGRFDALDVMIFRNDHEPPHFHVVGPGFSGRFTIDGSELLSCKGKPRPRDIRAIEAWGQRHRDKLYKNWWLAKEGKPPEKITD